VTTPARPDLLPLDEAVARVLAEVTRRATERVALLDAGGRVLAADLTATSDLPADAASLMDGYAVRASTVQPGAPLRVAFTVAAGRAPPRGIEAGECARIFTGGLIPAGADAVVRQEEVDRKADDVTFRSAPAAGDHVRAVASDARRGDRLVESGAILDAGALALAATVGVAELFVVQRPCVAILATGDELRSPGERLDPGTIYESNTFGLATQTISAGGAPVVLGRVKDDADSIATRLASTTADICVTSGGASVGDYDFAAAVLDRLGGQRVFWQVAIRPGRPILFGVLPRNSRPPILFFALPGNPGASALTFDLLVRPAIRAMMGAREARRPRVQARLEKAMRKPAGLAALVRGTLVARDAVLWFRAAPLQGSMSIASLSGLAAVAIVAADATALEAGAMVDVEPWLAVGPA